MTNRPNTSQARQKAQRLIDRERMKRRRDLQKKRAKRHKYNLRHGTEARKPRRRRCHLESCRALYVPAKPNQRFCSPKHKNEYHHHTESFRKTKEEILKLVREEVARLLKPEVDRLLNGAIAFRLRGVSPDLPTGGYPRPQPLPASSRQ